MLIPFGCQLTKPGTNVRFTLLCKTIFAIHLLFLVILNWNLHDMCHRVIVPLVQLDLNKIAFFHNAHLGNVIYIHDVAKSDIFLQLRIEGYVFFSCRVQLEFRHWAYNIRSDDTYMYMYHVSFSLKSEVIKIIMTE